MHVIKCNVHVKMSGSIETQSLSNYQLQDKHYTVEGYYWIQKSIVCLIQK